MNDQNVTVRLNDEEMKQLKRFLSHLEENDIIGSIRQLLAEYEEMCKDLSFLSENCEFLYRMSLAMKEKIDKSNNRLHQLSTTIQKIDKQIHSQNIPEE